MGIRQRIPGVYYFWYVVSIGPSTQSAVFGIKRMVWLAISLDVGSNDDKTLEIHL